ncbi:hypothetical protein BST61_g9448 [Cercospora zeina]
MNGKYVPPGRRQSAINNSHKPEEKKGLLLSTREIKNHYHPAGETPHYPATSVSGSLQDSAATPGKLAYVCLFDGHGGPANPRWDSDNILFCKTNLHLLSEYATATKTAAEFVETARTVQRPDEPGTAETATEPADSVPFTGSQPQPDRVPIAIFQQLPRTATTDHAFSFVGYYTISNLEFLEPRSDALIRMLEQKWSYVDKYGKRQGKARTQESWNQALCKRWAVVKFKQVVDQNLAPPQIERLPGPESKQKAPKKSVNEMLEELRMSAEDKKEAENVEK